MVSRQEKYQSLPNGCAMVSSLIRVQPFFFAIDMAWSIEMIFRAMSPCPHILISYAYLTAIIILTFSELAKVDFPKM